MALELSLYLKELPKIIGFHSTAVAHTYHLFDWTLFYVSILQNTYFRERFSMLW